MIVLGNKPHQYHLQLKAGASRSGDGSVKQELILQYNDKSIGLDNPFNQSGRLLSAVATIVRAGDSVAAEVKSEELQWAMCVRDG